ncbi:MAG: queuosine precursor transporter [Candidatus Woesearchaeota archaeon]
MNSKQIFWLIGLTSLFVISMILADIAATKFVLVGGIVSTGGIFLFSLIFIARDALHKLAGEKYVKKTIIVAAFLNLFVALYLYFVASLKAPDFFELDSAWSSIFMLAPSIVLGSIIAATSSQWVNTIIYEKLSVKGSALWERVIYSNIVSVPIDSVLFVLFAFFILPPLFGAQSIESADILGRIVSGQTLFKFLIVLATTPIIYLIPERIKIKNFS